MHRGQPKATFRTSDFTLSLAWAYFQTGEQEQVASASGSEEAADPVIETRRRIINSTGRSSQRDAYHTSLASLSSVSTSSPHHHLSSLSYTQACIYGKALDSQHSRRRCESLSSCFLDPRKEVWRTCAFFWVFFLPSCVFDEGAASAGDSTDQAHIVRHTDSEEHVRTRQRHHQFPAAHSPREGYLDSVLVCLATGLR